MNRPELVEALRCVDSQTYPNLEIVLVDATGKGLDRHKHLNLQVPLREIGDTTPRNRPAAANMALREARGKYLLFLDEDDLIAPAHIATLFEALRSQPDCLLAYSDTQVIDTDGKQTDFIFSHAFDLALLKRDNYIPIHSVLFSQKLLAAACAFDETLDIYEDWDFWLQCAVHSDFYHVAGVSAYYRIGGTSGTALNAQNEKYQKGSPAYQARIQIFTKWIPSISAEEFNTILGALDQSDYVRSVETEVQLKGMRLHELDHHLQEKNHEYKLLETYAKSLEKALEDMLNSRLWRTGTQLARPFRLALRAKQRIGLALTSTALGKRLYDSVRGSDGKDGGVSPQSADIKETYSEKARQTLSSFLSSAATLRFVPPENPKVSIVVILYNQAPLSLLCLQSLLENVTVSFEVIIIDNASSDETAPLLQKIQGANILYNASNTGFVEAVNQGAAVARGEHILLLNNDAIVQPEALEHTIATLESSPDIGAVGGKIVLLDGSLQEAGSIIWNDGSCLGYGRGRNPLDPEFMFQREVDYCSGAFLAIKRALFEELNGLDMDYAPAYYEESDFCVRLKKHGYRVLYEPRSVIIHYEFASSGGYSNASKLQIAHREIFAQKHADFLQTRPAPDERNILLARENAGQKARVLVLDDRVPLIGLGAGYPRCRQLLTDLHAMDLQVTFYPLRMPEEDWERTYATLPIAMEVMLNRGTQGLQAFLQERKNNYDFILVSRDHNMDYLNELLSQTPDLIGSSHLIYDAEAVAASREVIRLRLQGRKVSEQEATQMLSAEIAVARHADAILCVSTTEAALFQQAGHQHVYTLGHSCEMAATPNAYHQRKDFLFVGSLQDNGSPNVDSLLWFAQKILPTLKKALGDDIRIIVVGKNNASELGAIQDASFKFLGMQDDLTHFYNMCRVFIAPTRFAAGIPHKIHEAAAHGIPVVATDLLARQLSWEHEVEILSSVDATAFAENCIRLYEDARLWNDIRENALRAVERDCSPSNFLQELGRIFVH